MLAIFIYITSFNFNQKKMNINVSVLHFTEAVNSCDLESVNDNDYNNKMLINGGIWYDSAMYFQNLCFLLPTVVTYFPNNQMCQCLMLVSFIYSWRF